LQYNVTVLVKQLLLTYDTKSRMTKKLTTTIEEVKDILGTGNVFGSDEWLKFLPQMMSPSDTRLTKVSDIPWPKSILIDPKTLCKENLKEHFLFLGMDTTSSGVKLNLFNWLSICQKGFSNISNGPKFSNPAALRNFYQKDCGAPAPIGANRIHYTVRTCEFRWYFMPKNVLESSIDKPEVHQPSEYAIAEAIEVVTANILYFLINHEYMHMTTQIARTKSVSVSNYGQNICVWSDQDGLTAGTLQPGKYPGAALWREESM